MWPSQEGLNFRSQFLAQIGLYADFAEDHDGAYDFMRVFGEWPIEVLTLAATIPTTSAFATLAIREIETHYT